MLYPISNTGKKSTFWQTFDTEDDYCTGCRNVSHCQQQQSYSGLRSPRQSNSTFFWNFKQLDILIENDSEQGSAKSVSAWPSVRKVPSSIPVVSSNPFSNFFPFSVATSSFKTEHWWIEGGAWGNERTVGLSSVTSHRRRIRTFTL